MSKKKNKSQKFNYYIIRQSVRVILGKNDKRIFVVKSLLRFAFIINTIKAHHLYQKKNLNASYYEPEVSTVSLYLQNRGTYEVLGPLMDLW